jgi:hypothetical protein
MLFRLNWLFLIIIYLSVNGQVFAKAIHICPEMAMTSSALYTSTTRVKIHDHDQKNDHHGNSEQINKTHNEHESAAMDDCKCVDCDCVQNITGQTNSSLFQDSKITDYFPFLSKVLANLNRHLISQPNSNPYRPPTTS